VKGRANTGKEILHTEQPRDESKGPIYSSFFEGGHVSKETRASSKPKSRKKSQENLEQKRPKHSKN